MKRLLVLLITILILGSVSAEAFNLTNWKDKIIPSKPAPAVQPSKNSSIVTSITAAGQDLLDSFVKTKNKILDDTDIGRDIKARLEDSGLKEVDYDKAEQEATKIANQARALQKRINALEGAVKENKPLERRFMWGDGLDKW